VTATPWGMAAKSSRQECTHATRTMTEVNSRCYTLTRGSVPVRVKAFVEHLRTDRGVEWITSELER
jgi:hypothetical protein